MASEPVRSTAIEAAPKDYSIPAAQQIRLLSVRASFTDNGAASDWLPALQILDNNGNVLVTAADQGVKVTAGSDADVSWFPGVKVAAAAAASSGAAWFFASRVTSFTVTTTSPIRRIPWTHFVTSDPSVFTMGTHTAANDTVIGNKAGIYLGFTNVGWHSPMTYPGSVDIITDFFGVDPGANNPFSAQTTASDPVGQVTEVSSICAAITNAVPGEISVRVHNWDASNRNVDSAFYIVAYLPNSTFVT